MNDAQKRVLAELADSVRGCMRGGLMLLYYGMEQDEALAGAMHDLQEMDDLLGRTERQAPTRAELTQMMVHLQGLQGWFAYVWATRVLTGSAPLVVDDKYAYALDMEDPRIAAYRSRYASTVARHHAWLSITPGEVSRRKGGAGQE